LQSGGCGSHFFDITEFNAEVKVVKVPAPYPTKFKYEEKIRPLFSKLSWDNIRKNLEQYATYYTRFSETVTGTQASEWLLAQVQDVVLKSKKQGVTAKAFPHALWPQNSIVVTVPGRSDRTVIVGAHLDSVNSANRTTARAPGVDDNASGSFLLLESLRVLLSDKGFGPNKLQNTIEFHWYAAEEGGLRGSQDIFTQYSNARRDVWAMLNQDMVGYTKATLDAGKPESFGLITDNTNPELNEYIGRVIDKVSRLTLVSSKDD
jgi:leucyl aminopeptidase